MKSFSCRRRNTHTSNDKGAVWSGVCHSTNDSGIRQFRRRLLSLRYS
ncbi:hypothetical protein KCP69_02560 [Salmonella enterica subsp. enterica]|nr:hypothetical protein KCP69_02560 [Salmonella enterica subsp. enterica]